MKIVKFIFFLIIVTTKVYGNDTTSSFRISGIKNIAGTNNWEGIQMETLKKALISMDSLIDSGNAKYEDYFDRGTLKQVFEDNIGALNDYNKAIEKDNKRYEALVNRSVLLLNQRKFPEALLDMNKLIKLYPDTAILYNNRGFLLQAQKKYEEAIKDYSKSCDLDKDYINPFVNKIRCYILLKKFKEAKMLCDELLTHYPNNPSVYVELSDFYIALSDLNKAMEYLNIGVKISKNDPEMYIVRSQFKDDILNNDEDAIRDCDTAIALSPQSSHGYFARTRPLFDMKLYDRIIQDCNKAILLDSTMYEAWVMRGDAYDLSGNISLAMYNYEHAINMHPTRERAYVQLVTLYTLRGHTKSAIPVLNRLLDANPTNERGLFERAHIELAVYDFKGAKKDFTTLTELFPDNPAPWYFLAVALDSLGEKENICKYMKISYDLEKEEEKLQHALTESHVYLIDNCRNLIPEANLKGDDLMRELLRLEKISDWNRSILILDKFLELFPDSAFFYYSRGKNKRKVGRLEDAIIDYKKGLKLNPNIPDAWISLGVAQQKLGRDDEAMESYKQTIKIDPKNEMPYNNIAAILRDKNKYSDAVEYLKQAISLSPNYVTAIRQLGECYEAMGDKANACIAFKKAEALGDGASISKRIFNCN